MRRHFPLVFAVGLLGALGACGDFTGPGDHPLLSEEEAGPADPEGEPYPGDLKADAPLPAWVSHEHLMTAVRHQGNRKTCMAFSLAAALEGFHGAKQHLSVEQLWRRIEKMGPDADRLGRAVNAEICPDHDWPYGGEESDACQAHADYRVPSLIRTGTDPERLKAILAQNERNNIVFEVRWVQGYEEAGGRLVAPEGTNWEEVRDACIANKSCGLHIVVLVGYHQELDADGESRAFFRFKNSWGTQWGDAGYGYVSADYLRKFGRWGAVMRPAAE